MLHKVGGHFETVLTDGKIAMAELNEIDAKGPRGGAMTEFSFDWDWWHHDEGCDKEHDKDEPCMVGPPGAAWTSGATR